MKITILGSGASEGIPSMFCSCRVCENARKVGGKEVRARTGLLINDDLIIDFSSDNFLNAVRHKVNYLNVKDILITHSHTDHLCPEDVLPRRIPDDFDGSTKTTPIVIHCSDTVASMFEKYSAYLNRTIAIDRLKLGVTVDINGYKVTPFRSVHVQKEQSMIYLLQKDGKNYLHAFDTGSIVPSVFDYLKDNGIKLDCAILDCTYGLLDTEYFGHMNLNQVAAECEKFKSEHIFTEKTKIYVSHICHWSATHEELAAAAAKKGINVCYDGLVIEF